MPQRNVHGDWTMHFEKRMLFSKVIGETNYEAGLVWFDEMKTLVLSSPERDTTPWVYLLDCREWIGASKEAWESNNAITDWMVEHNCALTAVVLPGKLQAYAIETHISDMSIMQFYFDYDDAHQVCLDKMLEVQTSARGK
ncbi:hypothetical protein L4C34_05735 [Vibrio profundum]|uniref:hypothetical protein n=1 Tax=Vibrio profundum TaxID=2910247 RepID=UPI003D11E60A